MLGRLTTMLEIYVSRKCLGWVEGKQGNSCDAKRFYHFAPCRHCKSIFHKWIASHDHNSIGLRFQTVLNEEKQIKIQLSNCPKWMTCVTYVSIVQHCKAEHQRTRRRRSAPNPRKTERHQTLVEWKPMETCIGAKLHKYMQWLII